MYSPLPLGRISITGSFFSERIDMAIDTAIPYMWSALNDGIPGVAESGCMHNFLVAAGMAQGPFKGFVFQDSDLWKWIEGASYSLSRRRDPALEDKIDKAVAVAEAAQLEDGYLDTYYIINGVEKRFTNLRDHHELYVAGHMFEAAAAYAEATGKRRLLEAAVRFADCIDRHFGPEEGKLHGYPGHEEIELGLARLYKATGEKRFIRLADYFLSQRGTKPHYFEAESAARGEAPRRALRGMRDQWADYSYYQADVPVRQQTVARGHAVRQGYLLAGMAETGGMLDDQSLITACERVFRNIVERQMYITGGVGSTCTGEAYSFDYDLPNEICYNETCASIALIMAAARLNRIRPSSVYGDTVERCLYNGILSGVSLDGTKYFYMNPLAVWPRRADERQGMEIDSQRRGWFGCACCPPNLLRTLTGLGGYLFTDAPDTLYVDQYVSSAAEAGPLLIRVESGFPFDGHVAVRIEKNSGKNLALRRPGWAREMAVLVNGHSAVTNEKDGYVLIASPRPGDVVTVDFPMEVRFMRSSKYVPDDAGKAAVTRGPLVYCLEEADNGARLWDLGVTERRAAVEPCSELGGIPALRVPGRRRLGAEELYSDAEPRFEDVTLTFVPYYAWGNRGKGEMAVWTAVKE